MRETSAPPDYSASGKGKRGAHGAEASAEWLARSLSAVWHPCTQMKQHESLPLVPVARGDGAWLYDFDGRRYLDGVSS